MCMMGLGGGEGGWGVGGEGPGITCDSPSINNFIHGEQHQIKILQDRLLLHRPPAGGRNQQHSSLIQ
jgi:hypothetical protein